MADFKPLKIPPGVVGGTSNAVTPGRWFDANMVRWINGSLAPVSGWEKVSLSAAVASPIRAMHVWADNLGGVWTGVLCESNIYVIDSAGNLTDVTPVGGITGPASDIFAGGYGDDAYSSGTYGTARSTSAHAKVTGPAWSLDNWGQTLLIMSSYDGRLLQWTPNDVVHPKALVVANCPTGRLFVVTPERYVIVFGGSGAAASVFSWCNQEDITNWTFSSVTSTAGTFNIEPAAPILFAQSTKHGTIFFTSIGAYLIQYIGVPYIFDYVSLSSNAIPLSAAALVGFAGKAAWLAEDGFWEFNGVSVSRVDCSVIDWLKSIIDPTYKHYRVAGVNLGLLPEIWWFFPAINKTENDHYVLWNYAENWWSTGMLKRTCGYNSSLTTFPVMSDGTNVILHERNTNFYFDYVMLPYATCSAINTDNGGVITSINQAIVDHNAPANAVNYTFAGRNNRMRQDQPAEIASVPPGPIQARTDGYLDFRISARDITITIASAANGVTPWSFGSLLMKTTAAGKR